MKHFTYYQDVAVMKILISSGLEKLRSEKIIYCLVNPILRKLVTWAMRSSETDFFFEKTGVQKLFARTTKNTIISPNFLVWKFCGKAQFAPSFVQFVQNYAETAPFHKTATKFHCIRWNYGVFHSATCKSFIETFWPYLELMKVYSPASGNKVLIL